MKLDTLLVLCALLAAVCGCGREEPNASQDMTDAVDVVDEVEEVEEADADFTNSIGMKFNLIQAGEFWMGSLEDEEDRHDDEGPVHEVRITKPYYLAVTEVTQGQWEEVMGTRPWEEETSVKSASEHVVSYVSWDDAVDFCRQLSEKDGRTYRLPTEAEWEYACRAGGEMRYCFGGDPAYLGSYAWIIENAGVDEEFDAREVGLKLANAWGLFDMHGNVLEWCQDWYDQDYYKSSPTDDPTGPPTGSYRVNRGGCFAYTPGFCRSAGRSALDSYYHGNILGFRVALDPAE